MKNSYASLLFCLVSLQITAQDLGMTTVAADGMTVGPSWKTVGQVTMHPDKAAFVKTTASSDAKTAILLGTPGSTATLPLGTGDLLLKADFMLAPGSELTVNLPNGAVLRLSDSWKQRTVTAAGTSGSVAGLAPLQNAAKAPGLWQSIRLQMRAGDKGSAARVEQLHLNGVLLFENAFLPTVATAQNSLSFEVTQGTAALRNVAYLLQSEPNLLKILPMRYTLYKGWAENFDQVKPANIVKEDVAYNLTQEWGASMRDFHLIYDIPFVVEKADTYIFNFIYMSHLQVELDGKEILASQWNDFVQNPVSRSAQLAVGPHQMRLFYHRSPWRQAALGVMVSTPTTRAYALHALSSVPEVPPIPTLVVSSQEKPEMIRSFIQVAGEPTKRTHCLSVGSPQGTHYSIDLNHGTLLQTWKGQFADVTDMWYERGEPQLLKPMGNLLVSPALADFAQLPTTDSAWPDSLTTLTYKGLKIETNGQPTIRYVLGSDPISDSYQPEADGLTRRVTATGSNLYVRAATGSSITQVEKGLYEVDGQRYFVKLDPKMKVTLRTGKGQQELLIPVAGTASYSLIW